MRFMLAFVGFVCAVTVGIGVGRGQDKAEPAEDAAIKALKKVKGVEVNTFTKKPGSQAKSVFARLQTNGDAAMQNLRALKAVQMVGFLDFSKITDKAIEPLAGLPELTEVRVLYISTVTDASLKTLVGCPKLKVIWYDGCNVTDKGIAYLKDAPNIESVAFYRTKIKGAGFASLAALPNLRSVMLEGNPVDDAGLKTICGCKNIEILTLAHRRHRQGHCFLRDLSKLRDSRFEL